MTSDPTPAPVGGYDAPDEVPDAARAALARVRLAAHTAPTVPAGPTRTRRETRTVGSYSGARPDDRDPQTLVHTWDALVAESGWTIRERVSRLHQLWPAIVGQANAEHAIIESFDPAAGTLLVRASSTAWAESLRLMVPMISQAVAEAVGVGAVTSIEVVGPAAPSWSHGRRRVAGRGPRDTYG